MPPNSTPSRVCRSSASIGYLLNYDRAPDDVDAKINNAAYIGVTTRGQFSPNTVINDARQRWLFRMVHSQRPLQEKMALFWHNHFATAYSKVAGTFGAEHGTKMMDGKARKWPASAAGRCSSSATWAWAASTSC